MTTSASSIQANATAERADSQESVDAWTLLRDLIQTRPRLNLPQQTH